jgi:pimeloyl-ACP methyl ester carboxylesterase
MQTQACRQMHGVQSIANAGHWVQQERPAQTVQALLDFFHDAKVMP